MTSNNKLGYSGALPKRPAVSKSIPTNNEIRVPNFLVQIVAMGETMSAIEIDRPPTKAYSRAVAPGNVLLAR